MWRWMCGAAMCLGLGCVPAAPDPGGTDAGPAPARLARIPDTAEFICHRDGQITVLDRSGRHITQITFGPKRNWEHAAASFDRRYIVANEQLPNPAGEPGGRSRLWLFDLELGTEARLLPHFISAGNGGVDWDPQGFIYFAAKEQDPFPRAGTREEHLANAGANDVYRVRPDSSGLQRIINSPGRGEADVSVSADGRLVTYNALALDPANPVIELWVAEATGSNPRRILVSGKPGVDSVHDPELSPDNRSLVFSRVNTGVPPNFPNLPAANTAHDIWAMDLDGSNVRRLTKPGPISIAPDWVGGDILYLELNDRDQYLGLSLVSALGTDQTPARILHGLNIAKWIPAPAAGTD